MVTTVVVGAETATETGAAVAAMELLSGGAAGLAELGQAEPHATVAPAASAQLVVDDWVQCEKPGCGKWRRLPPGMPAWSVPEPFDCSMRHWLREGEPESMATCSFPQEPERMPLLADLEKQQQAPARNQEPAYRKSPWNPNEDELLRTAVMKHGSGRGSWSSVAAMVPGRVPKQCRERWHNHVDPSISHEPWSEEENALLLRRYQDYDGKWSEISVALPGRPDNA